ncbi:alpha/beta hydrolase [Spirillospora sp. CA-294931]|uniref:alpha/beta hydrolase n=1 Tax=Spirillospora sp. CA-294931 TaxID=3240042 RepID=UPI003D8C94AE
MMKAAAVAGVVVLVACGPGSGCAESKKDARRASGASSSAAPAPPLAWAACTGLPKPEPGAKPGPKLECAEVSVPLDYARPSGETIKIALVRARATDPGRRIGSLLFNPGGPGGSGIEFLAGSAGDYAALNARYDLVSFDPRGVGRSAPVKCLDDRRQDAYNAADWSPDTPAEVSTVQNLHREFVAACNQHSAKLLPQVGTVNVVRDLDIIRAALRDQKLHYFGISYGTFLGGAYAHRYPAKVGRMVLDAAYDPSLPLDRQFLTQAEGFQHALDGYAAACAKQGRSKCPLGTTKDAVVGTVSKLLTGLDAKPLPTEAKGRVLTQNLGMSGITGALYSQAAWEMLTMGLITAVQERDGTVLLGLADSFLGRDDKGHYNGTQTTYTAVTCADTTARTDAEGVRSKLPAFTKASPIFGPELAWSLINCDGWPYRGDGSASEVSAPGATPLLVIGNTGAPATPYAQSQVLARRIGASARFLTLRGQGHGAYATGNKCLRAAVDKYLLDGTVPAKDTTCS